MISQLKESASGYEVFKNVMLHPGSRDAYVALSKWAAADGRRELSELALKAGNDVLETEASYNRLCIGPGELLVPPYESVWRSGEKIMNNHFTAAVAYAYAEAGLVVNPEDNNEMADYFPNEIEFLYYLAAVHGLKVAEGNDQLAEAIAQTHDLFWAQHLGHWAKPFLETFIKESDSKFWSTFGRELLDFLQKMNRRIELSQKMIGVQEITVVSQSANEGK